MGTRIKKDRRAMKNTVAHNGDRGVNHHSTSVSLAYRSGILPVPEELERYEVLCPGITDRLMKSYENQVTHRISCEKVVIDGDSKRSSLGQIFAFVITVIILIGGFILILFDKSIAGLSSIFLAISSLVAVFIGGAVTRSKERQRKAK